MYVFDVMLHIKPCKQEFPLKNKLAMFVASLVFLHGMKCAIFKKLWITKKMESLAH